MAKQQHDKKYRGLGAQTVTANRLADGAVVYRTAFGGWTETIDEATVAADREVANALLAEVALDVARSIVVAPYLIDVELRGARVRPAAFRERIRALGPTIPASIHHYDSF